MAGSSHVSLDELIALNDEIIALSRAGVPLHRGLSLLGRELPGRLGRVAETLGGRLERGENLEEALREAGAKSIPPAYLAVVRAGLRAGRLPVALEGVATTSRRAAQLRRTIGLALIYPVVVSVMAYVLLILTLAYWLPLLVDFQRDLGVELAGVVPWLARLGPSLVYWAPFPPALILLGLFVRWLLRRLPARGSNRSVTARRWAGVGGLLHAGRMAGFAEVLALLVEQQVPLGESLVLAGDSSGDRNLAAGCRALAEQLERGRVFAADQPLPAGIPPLLAWMVVNGRRPEELADSLSQVAESYWTKARQQADWLSLYLPMWLTAGIGGTAVATYAVAVFAPWCRVLVELGPGP